MLTPEDKDAIAAIVAASEQRIAIGIEKTETALLTAFHQLATPLETRAS